MRIAIDQSPTPLPRVRGSLCPLGPTGKAFLGYAAFFTASLSLFGAMVFLSLLP